MIASVPHPREPTLRPSRAPGTPPRRAPILHGTKKKKKMSRRVTGQPPPRPTPCAGRTRCLRARAARPRELTISSSRREKGGGGRAGPDTIWQSTAAAPAAPSSRLRDTQPRAGSGSCGGGRRSTTSHPPSLLPPLLPAPLPWQRGAKALSPAPPSVPPPAARPGSPPAC